MNLIENAFILIIVIEILIKFVINDHKSTSHYIQK